MGPEVFRDRHDAGRVLAERLASYRGRSDVLVLALPRGGVPVGWEVAATLSAPLDVLLVRKLGVPHSPELAMGAIASGGLVVMNDDVVQGCAVTPEQIRSVTDRETAELQRREHAYRGDRASPRLAGQVVIVVDDGIATGATMLAAVRALRTAEPAKVVVGVPVGSPESCARVTAEADETVCVSMPERFSAVGQAYDDFRQVSDAEVCRLLAAPQSA